MSHLSIAIAVIVYCAIAGISKSARSASARSSGELTVFPVLKSAEVLIFGGGLFCVAFGAYTLHSRLHAAVGLCFMALGLVALLVPLRPITVSLSGVETRGALWWKKRFMRWNEIEKVEVWNVGRMVVLIHGKLSITHSQYHVDQEGFIREVQHHVPRDKWLTKKRS